MVGREHHNIVNHERGRLENKNLFRAKAGVQEKEEREQVKMTEALRLPTLYRA